MKVLLIGNKGQVGREVEELAKIQHISIVGFDIDNLDICDSRQVNDIFEHNSNVDVVINTAAYTAVDKAEDEPEKAFAVNCDGVRNLALACKAHNLPLIHISTDYVFAGDKIGEYVENDVPHPLSTYGKSKLAGDEILIATWEQHIILRVSWVFGKYGNNFVKTILRLARERKELNIVGDQLGCPTAARDIARVLLELVAKDSKHWDIYNYCSSPVTTWYEFAKKIVEYAGIKTQLNKITTAQYPTKAKRPHNSELCVAKIVQDFGIQRAGWEQYLKEVVGVL